MGSVINLVTISWKVIFESLVVTTSSTSALSVQMRRHAEAQEGRRSLKCKLMITMILRVDQLMTN